MTRWVGVLLVLAGCATRAPNYFLPDGRTAEDVVAQLPASQENVTITELRRSENSSVSAVQVRDREQPHIHMRYDLTVVVIRGHGTLWLNGAPHAMQRGDAVYISKGTPHYFVNEAAEPSITLVVFSPAFSGRDQAPVP